MVSEKSLNYDWFSRWLNIILERSIRQVYLYFNIYLDLLKAFDT